MIEKKKMIGRIRHFYANIGVAVIDIMDELTIGDKISIEGASTHFQQIVDSMQIEHKNVKKVGKGDSIGIKLVERVRENDKVYKIL